MPDPHEGVALLVSASGVLAVLCPTVLQVMWLIAMGFVVARHARSRARTAPAGGR